MTTTKRRLLTAVVLLLAGRAAAATARLGEGSRLSLEGTSTLHSYESRATRLELSLTTEKPLPEAVAAGQAARMTVRVPVAGLKSPHSGLDKNLRKALKAGEFPDIVFVLSDYRVEGAAGAEAVVARGELSVAGAARPVELNARLSWKRDSAVVDGKQPLLMSEFGVKPPSMMLGAIKTDDKIVVKYHLELLIDK